MLKLYYNISNILMNFRHSLLFFNFSFKLFKHMYVLGVFKQETIILIFSHVRNIPRFLILSYCARAVCAYFPRPFLFIS